MRGGLTRFSLGNHRLEDKVNFRRIRFYCCVSVKRDCSSFPKWTEVQDYFLNAPVTVCAGVMLKMFGRQRPVPGFKLRLTIGAVDFSQPLN